MFHSDGLGPIVLGAVAVTFLLSLAFSYIAVCAFCREVEEVAL